jgi:uncharacterized protein (TIGR02646 family)
LIRIIRPAAAPAKLASGAVLLEALIARRRRDPDDGASMERAFAFSRAVYGAKTVKNSLRKMQYDKCCYCEVDFTANSPGDVEHFRPKTCFQQAIGTPVLYPGYYWLAYDWENLYFTCDICNRSGKKNLFPLVDPEKRRTAPDQENHEEPLLVDPVSDDPRNHIRFEFVVPSAITERGAETIKVLKLNRGELRRLRIRHLKLLQAYVDLANISPAHVDPAKRASAIAGLDQAVLPESPFTSMSIDYLARPACAVTR